MQEVIIGQCVACMSEHQDMSIKPLAVKTGQTEVRAFGLCDSHSK